MRSKTALSLLLLTATHVFAAGYILPNGTILYDGDTQDDSLYKIEGLSKQPQSYSNPVIVQQSPQVQIIRDARPTTVIIEGSRVVYERPVAIRERYYYGNPVYDIVDAAGTVLVFGLLYDSLRHGFYHPELHRGKKHYGRYRR